MCTDTGTRQHTLGHLASAQAQEEEVTPHRLDRAHGFDDVCLRETAIRLAEGDEQAKKKLDALLNSEEPAPEPVRPTRLSGAARGQRYHQYFSDLIPKLKERGFSTGSAPRRHYFNVRTRHRFKSGIHYACSFNHGDKARVELYMGSEKMYNKALFDFLYSQREVIEERFGTALNWERLDDNKASRVAVFPVDGTIDDDDESLEAVQNWMVEHLTNLDRALGPTLDEYTV